ncbi:phosphoribosyl-ATP diphosphatase [Enterococcus sp. AZ109]|uniref:phosphoribosyl-ATP diphosphatase n=1 Tax=Enterococcus sp. AZ109 TaxID=2774634 RepID=UPI003F21C839
MELKVKLISESEFFTVTIEDERTLTDIFTEMADIASNSFLLLGDRIIQKSIIEQIEVA